MGLLLLGLFFFLPAIFRSRELVTWKDDLINLLMGFFLICLSIYLMIRSKKVFFDHQSMYIQSKHAEKVVPLSSITNISLTMTTIGQAGFVWKIVYEDETLRKRSIRILPDRRSFELFKDAVSK